MITKLSDSRLMKAYFYFFKSHFKIKLHKVCNALASLSSANFLVYSSGNKYIVQVIVAVRIIFVSRISFISLTGQLFRLKHTKIIAYRQESSDKILTHSRSQEQLTQIYIYKRML